MAEGSSGKEKLKPMRGCLKTTQSQVNHRENLKPMRGSLKTTQSQVKPREKLKPMRGCLKTTQSQVKSLDRLARSNMDMNNMSSNEGPRLDTATNDLTEGSSRREKLKPIRSHLKKIENQVKPPDKVAESNVDMDSMSLKDMLRFLDEEEVLLTHLQSKMSEELSRLQVEEHVFLRTLKISGEQAKGPSNEAAVYDGLLDVGSKCNENQQQSSSEDQELIDALNLALKDNEESKPDNVEKGPEVPCA
ncbi:hypothetical protein GOP47_0027044 [Adiantum capillus-veneris]|nr:hypothetical protein GOP47_0027044 [Adiantum capillus-veneris]